MNHIDFFKLQAKNLFRDYKTQFVNESGSVPIYDYKPKYFDINGIFVDFDWDEENLSLMKIQHIFAVLVGFESWADLVNASESELELAKLLFDNQHKISLDEWQMYIADAEGDNNTTFDTESRIEIFKAVFANVDGHHNPFGDYRLHKKPDSEREIKKPHPVAKAKLDVQITSLPLSKADRAEFIKTANSVFETVMERMEPNNPELTRKLWDAGDYVDNYLLSNDMLPISRDYALSLIDAFLVHHVLGLAVEADKQTAA